MELVEVKVGELRAFAQSEYFRQMRQIPVSSPRAYSQYLNPSASGSDVALVYALTGDGALAGYIGILPASIITGNQAAHKIYFNSCWWVHPKLGKTSGMKLFYRMLQLTGGKMVFFELTTRTENILRTLEGMVFPPTQHGMKAYLGISFLLKASGILPVNWPVQTLFHSIGSVVNLPFQLRNRRRLSMEKKYMDISVEFIGFPDEPLWQWTRQFNQSMAVFRGYEELRWVSENPWMIEGQSPYSGERKKYSFSLMAHHWRNLWVKVNLGSRMTGLLCFTSRDGNYRIPYAWFAKDDSETMGLAILEVLIRGKALSVTCFNPLVVNALKARGSEIFLHTKPLSRTMAWTAEMDSLLKKGFEMQDGDGDAVFT